MAKAFKVETALTAVQKNENVIQTTDSEPTQSKLFIDYFSLETGEPISLEAISKRLKKRFSDIDRTSVGAMLDLFFIYQNWTGFYSREDSFSKYLNEEIQISRTHAYGVINSVELLNQYFIHKGNQESNLGDFMKEITTSIEDIGIKKLIIISTMKDDDQKFGYIDRLIEGEKITVQSLLQKPENKNKPKPKTSVTMEGNDLKVGNTLVLTFNSENKTIRNAVFKTVEKWYLKDLEPKKVLK